MREIVAINNLKIRYRQTDSVMCTSDLFSTLLSPIVRRASVFSVVVVVVITLFLPQHRGTARTAVQIHAVNLIDIRLVERWQPISNQS